MIYAYENDIRSKSFSFQSINDFVLLYFFIVSQRKIIIKQQKQSLYLLFQKQISWMRIQDQFN
jgi:hypothetical protein